MARKARDPNRLKFAVTAADRPRDLFPKRGGRSSAAAAAEPAPPSLAEMQLLLQKQQEKDEKVGAKPAEGADEAGGGPRISLLEGVPIATIKRGPYDGAVVHVTDQPGEAFDGADPIHLLGVDWFKGRQPNNGRRLTTRDIDELHDALVAGSPEYLEEELLDIYAEALQEFKKLNNRELAIPDDPEGGFLVPLPDCERRECIYICGPSGSGKSTWVARYCNAFRKLVPDVPIYVFSRLREDKIIDLLKPQRIVLDEDFARADPYEPTHFENSIVLFDDCDTIPEKKVADKVNKLRDDILETGRHQNVWCLTTAHQVTNYQKTRCILNECTKATVFPKSGSTYHIKRLLQQYFGFDKKQMAKALNLPSRWVTITRTAPQIVMHERGAYIV